MADAGPVGGDEERDVARAARDEANADELAAAHAHLLGRLAHAASRVVLITINLAVEVPFADGAGSEEHLP